MDPSRICKAVMQKHCVVNTRLKHNKNLMHSRTAMNRDIQPHLTWPLMLKICRVGL